MDLGWSRMVKYYKQETNWTCGPACVRMILDSFGVKKSEKQIVRLLKTNKIKGTWHKNIAELAERYKFDYVVERKARFSDLKNLKKTGWSIIVCYEYGEPHYSIVKKINWHSIYLIDPLRGPRVRYFISKFKKRWFDSEDRGWFIAFKRVK